MIKAHTDIYANVIIKILYDNKKEPKSINYLEVYEIASEIFGGDLYGLNIFSFYNITLKLYYPFESSDSYRDPVYEFKTRLEKYLNGLCK